MSLFTMLVRTSPALFAGAFAAALVCGLGGGLLIMLINQTLQAPADRLPGSLALFAGVAVVVMATQAGSQAMFAHLGQSCLGALRKDMAKAVVRAPYRQIEVVGRARIRSCLSDDATNIASFGVGLPILVTNVALIAGALVYLAWLSVAIFLAAGVTIGLGTVAYHLSQRRVVEHFQSAGRSQDRLYDTFDAMLGGAKELKLNAGKAARFLTADLAPSIDRVGAERARGLALLSLADGWGRFLFMILIGMALFSRLWLPAENATVISGYVIAFLYLMGPLEGVLSNLPFLNMARVSMDRVRTIVDELTPEPHDASVDFLRAGPVRVSLAGVTHGYFREREEDVFTLGPIDLAIEPGEATFIVGGNGSGKTTLAKLITGLYGAESGRILVNGRIVEEAARGAYRQLFSAVYADFHLFETLLEAPDRLLDGRANEWLSKLHLDHKVTARNGAFTTRDLSQGQRKRLALIAACLENRPILVFDEWAADQDPAFKDVFYREILGTLKARGKAAVVVTHDDRYFHLADRIVKLEAGRIVDGTDGSQREDAPARLATRSVIVDEVAS